MRAPTRILAIVVAALGAASAAGCDAYPYGSSRYDYGPSFERVPGYQPGYGNSSAAAGQSKWEAWRNYGGSFHHGPEPYP